MSIVNIFSNLFKKENPKNETPEGYCPSCWGRQEYGGKFYDAVYKERIDLNNIASKRGWIIAYAKKNLEGIKLEDKKGRRNCPSCSLTYLAK